jgi:hypothetical protein
MMNPFSVPVPPAQRLEAQRLEAQRRRAVMEKYHHDVEGYVDKILEYTKGSTALMAAKIGRTPPAPKRSPAAPAPQKRAARPEIKYKSVHDLTLEIMQQPLNSRSSTPRLDDARRKLLALEYKQTFLNHEKPRAAEGARRQIWFEFKTLLQESQREPLKTVALTNGGYTWLFDFQIAALQSAAQRGPYSDPSWQPGDWRAVSRLSSGGRNVLRNKA